MQSPNKFYIFFGLITMGLGSMPFLAAMGILPSRPPEPGDAPAWIAFAIGLAFVLAGIVVIVRSFAGADDQSSELPQTAPRSLRAFYDLLVMPIPILLALLFTWVAFGPGVRHFSMSIGFGGTGAAAAGNETLGRIMFGAGAVLGWIIVVFTLRTLARRWFARQEP
ncbi:MAG TPA: hypothetical protein VKR31_03025 [Rhizomicrobium sp.]|nr:hypothetical protein [Rhizomicrobium sp.]